MKLSQLLATKKVITSGFPAVVGLSDYSKGKDEVVLSSLAPSILAQNGVTEYYALELPRGIVFNSPQDIIVYDSVTEAEIAGKHVAGTLPPHLITACAAYTSVSIKNFDYIKDGDIAGAEL